MQAIRGSSNPTRMAGLLTAVFLPIAFLVTLSAWNWWWAIIVGVVNLGIATSPLVVLGGLRLRKRSPVLGTVLVAVFALGGVAGLFLFWGSTVSPWWQF